MEETPAGGRSVGPGVVAWPVRIQGQAMQLHLDGINLKVTVGKATPSGLVPLGAVKLKEVRRARAPRGDAARGGSRLTTSRRDAARSAGSSAS